MSLKLADPETEVEARRSLETDELVVETYACAAWLSIQEKLPGIDSEEYKVLYRPTMVGVYTARHQQMPRSDRFLCEHVFGLAGYPGCAGCREETEFLVAHQKRFF